MERRWRSRAATWPARRRGIPPSPSKKHTILNRCFFARITCRSEEQSDEESERSFASLRMTSGGIAQDDSFYNRKRRHGAFPAAVFYYYVNSLYFPPERNRSHREASFTLSLYIGSNVDFSMLSQYNIKNNRKFDTS